MLDVGWMELVLIGIVALIVVGPKELPGLFRTVGRFMGKARGMAREFQRSMEQAADESGLNEAARDLRSVNRLNLNSATNSARRYAEGLVREDDAAAPGAKPDEVRDDGEVPQDADAPAARPKPVKKPKPAKPADATGEARRPGPNGAGS
jgi:sec-independent protein translocase protein TatB